MKKIIFLLAVVGLWLTSCNNNEGQSLNNFVYTAATFHQLDDSYYLTNDSDEKLWPTASAISTPTFSEGTRVIVNYTILDNDPDGTYNYFVKINSMDELLTKDIQIFDENTTEQLRDSIGSDPIEIHNAWIYKKYLTIFFEMPVTYSAHLVNLVYDKTLEENLASPIILELTQNDNNSPLTGYKGFGIASFDISALMNDFENTVSINLVSKDNNGSNIEYPSALLYDFDTTQLLTNKLTNLADKLQGNKIDFE